MGLKGKLIGEFEVNSSADDFHHPYRHKPRHISAFSQLIHDCELHDGEFGQSGSTIIWRYKEPDMCGKTCYVNQVVEIDEEITTIVFTVTEGELMADYKSFVITLHTIPREWDTDLVRWTIDYEKLKEDSPHPVSSLDVLLNVSRHIEIHHVKNAS